MSEIVLTENVEDWELGVSHSPEDTILEIHIPKSPEIINARPDTALVYILHSTGAVSRAFFLINGVQYGHHHKPWTIVPRKKEVPYTLDDLLDISDNWFKKKGTQSMGKFMRLDAEIIVIYGYPATDLVGLCQNYLHSPNGKDWYTLTKKA